MPIDPYKIGGGRGTDISGIPTAEESFDISLDPIDPEGFLEGALKGTAISTGIKGALSAALLGSPVPGLMTAGRSLTGQLASKGFTPLSEMMESVLGIQSELGENVSSVAETATGILSGLANPLAALFSPVTSNIIGPVVGKLAEEIAVAFGYDPTPDITTGLVAAFMGLDPGDVESGGFTFGEPPDPLGFDPFGLGYEIDVGELIGDPFGGGGPGGGMGGPSPGLGPTPGGIGPGTPGGY